MLRLLFVLLIFTHIAVAETYREENPLRCEMAPKDELTSFAKTMSAIAVKNVPYTDTPNGYSVHRSCISQFGPEIISLMNKSFNDGLKCLGHLKGEGAKKNSKLLRDLLDSKKLVVHCNEKDYHWDSAAAHGSLAPEWDHPELGMKHPYVSINPNYSFQEEEGKEQVSEDFMEAVVFHEIFHNVGYAHAKTVDYAYACEECCFSDIDSEGKAAACRICSNSYTGLDDERYIADLFAYSRYSSWSKAMKPTLVARRALLNSKPGNESILLSFIQYQSRWDVLSELLSVRLFGKSIESENLKAIASIRQDIEPLVSAREALFMRGDLKSALAFYQSFNPDKLRIMLNSYEKESVEYKTAWNIWDQALYDMDVVFEKLEKDSAEYKAWDDVYKKIDGVTKTPSA